MPQPVLRIAPRRSQGRGGGIAWGAGQNLVGGAGGFAASRDPSCRREPGPDRGISRRFGVPEWQNGSMGLCLCTCLRLRCCLIISSS